MRVLSRERERHERASKRDMRELAVKIQRHERAKYREREREV